jgi:uncharacterized UBP type Zn finger protein
MIFKIDERKMNENVVKKFIESDFIEMGLPSKVNFRTPHTYQVPSPNRDSQLYGLARELLNLGIKADRIDKALAACALKSQTDAINWLISHSKDPILNSDFNSPTREFILLLCPVSRLANEISCFLNESQLNFGLNEAHFNNALPFMKLSSFFKVK